MPADLAVALDNFDYLVKTESVMQGRIQYVPWEFLTLVVNHRTPRVERARSEIVCSASSRARLALTTIR